MLDSRLFGCDKAVPHEGLCGTAGLVPAGIISKFCRVVQIAHFRFGALLGFTKPERDVSAEYAAPGQAIHRSF